MALIDINEIFREAFQKAVEESKITLETEKGQQQIVEFAKRLAEKMKIEPPQIIIHPGASPAYEPFSHTIFLPSRMKLKDAILVLPHEMGHALTFRRVPFLAFPMHPLRILHQLKTAILPIFTPLDVPLMAEELLASRLGRRAATQLGVKFPKGFWKLELGAAATRPSPYPEFAERVLSGFGIPRHRSIQEIEEFTKLVLRQQAQAFEKLLKKLRLIK